MNSIANISILVFAIVLLAACPPLAVFLGVIFGVSVAVNRKRHAKVNAYYRAKADLAAERAFIAAARSL